MKFKPMTDTDADTQANQFRLFPRGLYDFEVTEARERISQAGNDMMELQIKVYDKEGRWRTVFDYLVDTEKTGYKLRHFSKAVGLLPQYDAGEVTAGMCVGRTGRCQLSIKKDKKNIYPDKNVITDYVLGLTPGAPPSATPPPVEELDDDIPF